MSDIRKKIFSIDPEPDEDPIALVPELVPETEPLDPDVPEDAVDDVDEPDERPDSQIEAIPHLRAVIDIPAPNYRPIIDLVDAIEDDPIAEAITHVDPEPTTDDAIRPVLSGPAIAPEPRTKSLGWVAPLLTVLTVLGVGGLAYVYMQTAASVSPLGLAALITATFASTVSVIVLWAALRTLGQNQVETLRLAEIADRLTHADDAVVADVERMSSAIRRELARVDSRMAQTRNELDTLVAQMSRQSNEMTGISRTMTDRTESVATAMSSHRNAFADLSQSFETQMRDLSDMVQTQRAELAKVSETAVEQIGTATEALRQSSQETSERGQSFEATAETTDKIIRDGEARLAALTDRVGERAAELDAVYARQAEHLSQLADRLSDESSATQSALFDQSSKLSTLEDQISHAEGRLNAMLDHARDIQAQLTARLSDIDTTLSEADTRSRAFTADIADRMSDSVAQTRRELSIMEGELRALQSRMDDARTPDLGFEPTPQRSPGGPSKRLSLKPLETDFPPVEPDELAIPALESDETLDLIEPVTEAQSPDIATPEVVDTDVIRRPGEDRPSSRVFGRDKTDKAQANIPPSDPGKDDWRWRDMLSTMEPISDRPDATSAYISGVERPPPGVPLSPPQPTKTPDGSDVVARLCEVQLAPSTVIDEETLAQASNARWSGGEGQQSETVFARLNAPIIHLRGVLSADLEFRLRAESFRRSYDAYLRDQRDMSQLRAVLGSAEGRAYLLCAAALTAS